MKRIFEYNTRIIYDGGTIVDATVTHRDNPLNATPERIDLQSDNVTILDICTIPQINERVCLILFNDTKTKHITDTAGLLLDDCCTIRAYEAKVDKAIVEEHKLRESRSYTRSEENLRQAKAYTSNRKKQLEALREYLSDDFN